MMRLQKNRFIVIVILASGLH